MPDQTTKATAARPTVIAKPFIRLSPVIAAKAAPTGAKKSGTKPVERSWKDCGNGPTDWPSSSQSEAPRKTSMPASVTMNEGMLQ